MREREIEQERRSARETEQKRESKEEREKVWKNSSFAGIFNMIIYLNKFVCVILTKLCEK